MKKLQLPESEKIQLKDEELAEVDRGTIEVSYCGEYELLITY